MLFRVGETASGFFFHFFAWGKPRAVSFFMFSRGRNRGRFLFHTFSRWETAGGFYFRFFAWGKPRAVSFFTFSRGGNRKRFLFSLFRVGETAGGFQIHTSTILETAGGFFFHVFAWGKPRAVSKSTLHPILETAPSQNHTKLAFPNERTQADSNSTKHKSPETSIKA